MQFAIYYTGRKKTLCLKQKEKEENARLNDGSTCISYRGVIRGEGAPFLCQKSEKGNEIVKFY